MNLDHAFDGHDDWNVTPATYRHDDWNVIWRDVTLITFVSCALLIIAFELAGRGIMQDGYETEENHGHEAVDAR